MTRLIVPAVSGPRGTKHIVSKIPHHSKEHIVISSSDIHRCPGNQILKTEVNLTYHYSATKRSLKLLLSETYQ